MAERVQELQRTLQTELEVFRQMQADTQQNHRLRQQSLQQQHENEMVMQELKLLAEDAAVYKMIGPALVRQEPGEAVANVGKRLEFIGGELKRLDTQLAQLEEKQGKKQAQLIKLQQEMQRMQQASQQGGSAPAAVGAA